MIGILLLGAAYFAGVKHQTIRKFIGKIWKDLES